MYAIVRHSGGGCQDPIGMVQAVTFVTDFKTAKSRAMLMLVAEATDFSNRHVSKSLEAIHNWDGSTPIDLYIHVDNDHLYFDEISIVLAEKVE